MWPATPVLYNTVSKEYSHRNKRLADLFDGAEGFDTPSRGKLGQCAPTKENCQIVHSTTQSYSQRLNT